ncbi:hypothetical protein [Sphingomonas sp. Leaf34]|uniref:hypothetical protein n=1 Tax=Sphingomonas sp. Leaf34 TaxID=1736216 RepID=UPI0012E1C156|nr:hypothetical protein [Sphingomonas sp. Leaf34]
MTIDVARMEAAQNLSVADLGKLLKLWQAGGYGRVIEETSDNLVRYHFTPSDKAKIRTKSILETREASRLRGRLKLVNWNAVSAVATVLATLTSIAALIISIIALGRK